MGNSIESFEQFFEVPGGRIYAKSWKPSTGTNKSSLVLLHDSLGCVEMWRNFPQVLAETLDRQVITYDRLGFGHSSARTELPSVRFVSEEAEIYFPAISKVFSLGKFVLFGHSVGGAMAVIIASHFADSCEAIITESAQAFVEERTRQGITQAKMNFSDPATFGKLEKYHGDKTKWVLSAWIDVWLSSKFSSWSLENDLPKVMCPLFAIHGERDEYGSSRFPEMIASLASGPSKKWIVPDCGHVPHREKQDLIVSEVSAFLESI